MLGMVLSKDEDDVDTRLMVLGVAADMDIWELGAWNMGNEGRLPGGNTDGILEWPVNASATGAVGVAAVPPDTPELAPMGGDIAVDE